MKYFYHGTTKKIVAVFGAIFNDIYTARKLTDGQLSNLARVPLSYGPRSKFLARINEQKDDSETQVAIKLPRMSFEVTGIQYDAQSKLNSLNRRAYSTEATENGDVESSFIPVPYTLNFELSIFARSLDDVLQILEQIITLFKPDYTISVKDLEGPGTTTDIPFVLDSISTSDDYEGAFLETRPIIYTLTFSTRAKYLGSLEQKSVIEKAIVSLFNDERTPPEFLSKVVEQTEAPLSFISNVENSTHVAIHFTEGSIGYVVGESVVGDTSGYGALVREVYDDYIIVDHLDNYFLNSETLIGMTSGETKIVSLN